MGRRGVTQVREAAPRLSLVRIDRANEARCQALNVQGRI
jgi:hypothetical protein